MNTRDGQGAQGNMGGTTLYNEHDPYAAEWLVNLAGDGLVAPGRVETRSVVDLQPWELMLHTQVHFYAGIGGWSAALRLAGWPDDRPIWSMSLPCQPFSDAGKKKGFDDERHLWPVSREHIRACRPVCIVGEQVASKDGRTWFDHVQADLEEMAYCVWASILPVAGFGAPGERHRIFWLAYADGGHAIAATGNDGTVGDGTRDRMAHPAPFGRGESGAIGSGLRCRDGAQGQPAGFMSGGASERVGHADSGQSGRDGGSGACGQAPGAGAGRAIGHLGDAPPPSGGIERVVDSDHPRSQGWVALSERTGQCSAGTRRVGERMADHSDAGHRHPLPTNLSWRDADWLLCNDPGGPRWRPVGPGAFPLAAGLPRSVGALSPGLARLAMVAGCDAASLKRAKRYRVGTLRGYGNAINLHVAAEWIRTWMDDLP